MFININIVHGFQISRFLYRYCMKCCLTGFDGGSNTSTN